MNKIVIWLIFLVIVINLILLKGFWGYGVIGEDWLFLLNFKTNHNSNNIFFKIFEFWTQSEKHWGTQISYLGIIDQLFPSNYIVIQIINVIGKVTSTVLLFPLVLSLTRNKLLAFLSAIFLAIHYSSAGSLQQYANGVEYWAICFLILFILSYRRIVVSKGYNPFKLFCSLILLYLALSFGLYRLNGFIMILATVEIVLFLKKITSWETSLLRVIVFIILPVIVVLLVHHPTEGLESLLSIFLNHILLGNWFIFINPLAGLGLTFIPRSFLENTELLLLQNFNAYISYIIKNFAFSFTLIILLLGFILPLKTRRFVLISSVLLCTLITTLFLIISHYNYYPRYDILPSVLIGVFILSLSFSLGLEYLLSQSKNLLLLISFISPLISLFFTTMTWVLNINNEGSITYDQGMHRYLTVPAIGTSIFIASMITMIIQKKFTSQFNRITSYSFVLILVIFIFFTSTKELQIYKKMRLEGNDLKMQIASQESFYNTFIKKGGDIVIYYIAPPFQDLENNRLAKSLAPDIINWLAYLRHYYSYGPSNEGMGCIMVLAFTWHQEEALIKGDNSKISFKYPALCPIAKLEENEKIYAENRLVTLPLDKLFAFTIRYGKIQDVTADVKEKLKQGIFPEEVAKGFNNFQ